ncbi:MAG: DUF692 domain-containing protein [Pseudomonadales bacterium]|nr:DUF692 domain-containing protein [Pseudomonadales bacterium]
MKQPVKQGDAGTGLRRSMLPELQHGIPEAFDFFEIAPENWIGVGGKPGRQLREISAEIPLIAHGLSLSIGGPAPLDIRLLQDLRQFLDEHQIAVYSEHLSFTNDGGQLYDLLPMPFTEEAVHYTASRVREVQDRLERKIALENVSYYLTPAEQLSELEFVSAVIEEAGCDLLLDVNNVYVNSVNHDYDPRAYIAQLASRISSDKISYYHVAGHYVEADGLIIDTHGADVIDPVWSLLGYTYETIGLRPTLLERDFNIPALEELVAEVQMIREIQSRAQLPERTGKREHARTTT